ncbi:MAG: AAA family ATPase [Candidatus Levybacteria bacterium]|nr:AAA family ATPase [Candidatus Levybacteria bacterium]
MTPQDLNDIRNITVSGRIASGSTTLAKNLADTLGWRHVEGGDIFWERVRGRLGLDPKDTDKRPDDEDKVFDEELKKMLTDEKNLILETKLAGFNAQNIPGIFKILVVCEDSAGEDHMDIRIDRLINREQQSLDSAKQEVIEREKNDIDKWRRIYANGDENWIYWDRKYYDFVVNTYSHNADESLSLVLEQLGISKKTS